MLEDRIREILVELVEEFDNLDILKYSPESIERVTSVIIQAINDYMPEIRAWNNQQAQFKANLEEK